MLEAQETSVPSSVVLAPNTLPSTADQLDDGWDKLTLFVGGLKVNPKDPRVVALYDAYNAWSDLRFVPAREDGRPNPITGAKLTQAIADYAKHKAVSAELANQYATKVITSNTTPSKRVVITEPENITGTVPWWYWPLRIGGGITAGLVIYKLLRPQSRVFEFGGIDDDCRIRPARYSKGKVAVTCPSGGLFKNRAAQLADVISGGRYTHRESAYIMSESQSKLFRRAYENGWDASSFSGKLYDPQGNAHTLKEARKLLKG